VSDSTSVTRDHFRQALSISRLMSSPWRKMNHENTGIGSTIARPSLQSRLRSTMLSPRSITTESDTSTTPKARKSQSRSVSAVTRVIRLPVFFREKNESESRCRCS